ncbi:MULTISPECIES: heavy metal translocating P-type ATPase [Halobacteriales]|jgi:Cd2+/Zn2+-exporting ATPase|uniref:Cation-translocating P-type ATPase n=9 Tax=Halobacteriales TaxID=2235 RepID=A0A8J8C9G8_9EURY|nr:MULTISPECIES: cation-translocating P-type ATPase [Halobacteria]ELY73586.1 cadmium transporting P-type ATPase [Natrinema pallidum DSM 3751]KDE58262.1 HAD family hydrolase [Halostagnicola sp. A56]MBX0287952.1 cation-translocating P-type ATPase [Halomicroarcula salinisoli]MBX0305606.1 cation-translocating P-type ATPase [Halomicroarcula salinisoli]MDB2275491.1 cation-translocating P-type ATPase [Halorubrum ezzemoulense]
MNKQSITQYYRNHRKAIVTATSGLLYGGGWSLGYLTSFEMASAAILVLATVVGGYDIAKTAYHEVTNRTLGIKTLVTLAAIGAIVIGEYWEAAAVVFLFSLGSYLEGRTMRKTRTALQELLEMTPDTATVRRDGTLQEVSARDVEEGEVVVVKPGGKIPVDGTVVDGESAVNQAPVTGESAPVHKADSDEVYAGTVNQEGALEIRTTGAGSDTTLERIIRRVEEAQEAQSPTESLIDRFAKYYTPAVIALAIGAYAVTQNAILSLTLLVIGCPGALVIGPPVSIVSAIGNAARSGVLMKGGEHLERAGKIDLVAFDKTGTLTKGETTVSDIEGFGVAAADVLSLAATAEKKSEHHLADAIVDMARERQTAATDGGATVAQADDTDVGRRSVPDPDDFDVVAGKGVIAHADGQEVVVGNRALLDDRDVDVPDRVADYVREREGRGETVVHVVRDGDIIGAIAMRDELREAAPGVVAALQDAGIETVMLTGDNDRTAAAVAEEVGIDEYRAELLPEDKQSVIEGYQADGHVVAMVGDGINDAPSLATADVGIAMGAAGTDTAIETADMALMADDLERIPYAVKLSKATRWNVLENVGIAVLTVTVLLAGVLTSYVTLASGMLVHEASVLLVILNGMRLLRY